MIVDVIVTNYFRHQMTKVYSNKTYPNKTWNETEKLKEKQLCAFHWVKNFRSPTCVSLTPGIFYALSLETCTFQSRQEQAFI